jgi:hypothetical protein
VSSNDRLKYEFDGLLNEQVSFINVNNRQGYGKDSLTSDIKTGYDNKLQVIKDDNVFHKNNFKYITQEKDSIKSSQDQYRKDTQANFDNVASIIKAIPVNNVQAHINVVDVKSKSNAQVFSHLDTVNKAQSQQIDSLSLKSRNIQNNIDMNSKRANDLFRNYMRNGELSSYVNSMIRVKENQEWTKRTQNINAGFNSLERMYGDRKLLIPLLQTSTTNKERLIGLGKNVDNMKYITEVELKQYKFPLSDKELDPNLIKVIQSKSKDVEAVKNRVNVELTPIYVTRSQYDIEAEKLKSINFPMFQFSYPSRLNVNGRAGVGTAPAQSVFEVLDPNSANWATTFQNGRSGVFISRGDGFGVGINTGNTDPSTNALNIQLGNDTMFNLKNNGNTEMNTLDGNRISSSSQICINNTCITRADLDKVSRIRILPPRYIK